jgi:hypothetical protein
MSGSATPVIAQLVEAMRALAGSHPGFRPVHAKGIVCSGTFRGAPQARGVSRAPHLQAKRSQPLCASPMRAGTRTCTMVSPTRGRCR